MIKILRVSIETQGFSFEIPGISKIYDNRIPYNYYIKFLRALFFFYVETKDGCMLKNFKVIKENCETFSGVKILLIKKWDC